MALLLKGIIKRPICLSAPLLLLVGMGALFWPSRTQPQYCWLLFGRNAEASVLVCLRGKEVSFDHYANGKPTGRRDRLQTDAENANISIADPDGKTCYVITRFFAPEVPAGAHAELMIYVEVSGPISYRQYCDVQELADDPEKAPLSHFHGPLTAEVRKTNFRIYPGLCLKRGDKPTDMFAVVGTMDAEKGCWVVVNSQGENSERVFPDDVHPVVDVEFPSRGEADRPIRRRYPLDKVC